MFVKGRRSKNIITIFTIIIILTMVSFPAHATLGDRILKKGTSHIDVKVLQQSLKDLGFFNYKETTNYYGDITEKAVRDFQKSQGLVADGIFGPATLKALNALNKGGSAPKPPSPSKPGNLTYTQLLRVGSRGEDVKALQESLNKLGYNCGKADGIFGNATHSAVVKFQRDMGLSVDGIVGAKTIEAINKPKSNNNPDKPSTPSPSQPITPTKLLRLGSRGQEVKSLQESLNKLGFNCGKADGIFGNATHNAVIKFQKAKGLSVDGIVGAKTIEAINKAQPDKNSDKPSTPDRGNSGGKNIGADIVKAAKKYLGIPYVFGGSTVAGFDCSGFTQFIYRQFGISLPRTSTTQASVGRKVNRSNLQVGDLIIFSDTYQPGPSHTGIYMGNNQFIHSSSAGGSVIISSLNTAYYSSHFSYGRRVY